MTSPGGLALRVTLALILSAMVSAPQAPAPSALRGSWSASVGSGRVLHGVWSSEPVSRPNSARGAWALLGDTNQIVMEGTWSAEKSPSGWQGSWSARASKRGPSSGRSAPAKAMSGTWQAAIDNPGIATLAEMLQRTIEKQIGGSWRSGQLSGSWSIR